MEGYHRGPYLNALLHHTVLPPCHVKCQVAISTKDWTKKFISRILLAISTEDWTKQFISRILQLTHSQWIFQNISLHDKTHGFFRNENADQILQLINEFSEVAPEEVPKDSRFLLEINFSKLTKSHLKTQTYWTLAMDAAMKAKALELARAARAKQICRRLNTKIASRTKLGITAVEQQIRKDGMHRTTSQSEMIQANDSSQLTLDRFVK